MRKNLGMEKFTLFGDTPLFYIDEGKESNNTIMMVHGALESALMWDDFASELKRDYRVIRLDLPGHGLSSMPSDHPLSVDYMTDAMLFVLKESRVSKCTLIGHGFGGDVIAAFAKKYPEHAAKLVLFHSLPITESEERKQQRENDIQIINNEKIEQIAHKNATNYFAKSNRSRFIDTLDECAEMIMLNEKEGAISTLTCMMNRKDATSFLAECAIPTLLIFGRKDYYIGEEEAMNFASKVPSATVVWLEQSGHMGFVEEKKIALEATKAFIQ